MRKIAIPAGLALTLATLAPARATVAAARNMEEVALVPYAAGTHLEFLVREIAGTPHTYALAGARDAAGGLHIVDVTDPTAPIHVAFLPCNQHNNDPGISPDGTTVVLTADSGSGCTVPVQKPGYQKRVRDFAIVDISDLANPVLLGTPTGAPAMDGIHTVAFHPTQRIAYLSDQQTPSRAPKLWILDLRGAAPAATNVAMPPVGDGPHDLTFNAAGTRAYVSAVTASYILDTTDPLNPTLVSVIVNPAINIHHEAFLVPGGRYLAIVDEQAGAIANPQCPGGGVHVYDLIDERAPVWAGAFFADDTRTLLDPVAPLALPACTAHEGTFTPDAKRLSIAWYQGGARVFDTSALATSDAPPGTPVGLLVTEVGFGRQTPASDAWAAKMHPSVPGYVFSNDTAHGLVVYRLLGDAR